MFGKLVILYLKAIFLGDFSFVKIFLKNYRVTMTTTLDTHVRKIQWFCQKARAQNTTQKSISIVFCVSVIRHDSSLGKYRKQKQSPLEIVKMAHVRRVTASDYGTC